MKKVRPNIRLYDIAEQQCGYFTAKQANEAGISHKNHAYHVRTGAWIKEWRGIYRISRFPEPDDGQYALWSLWSCNRKGKIQGVYSHETALSLFDLGDVNPVKLDMTVPSNFRKTAQIPDILKLRKKEIEREMCEERMGYSVLKPLPNILMLIEEQMLPDETVVQALRDGIHRGIFIKKNLLKLELPESTKIRFYKLLERVQ